MFLRSAAFLLFFSFFAYSSFSQGGPVMQLTSPDFVNGGRIPERFTCQGEDVSPNLYISDVPQEAKSLVLIVDDPDASNGNWDHWIVFNIDPATRVIAENSIPGIQGLNDFGRHDWGGPCPPRGAHRYFFKLFALNKMLSLSHGAKKEHVLKAMEGFVLKSTELVGIYQKD